MNLRLALIIPTLLLACSPVEGPDLTYRGLRVFLGAEDHPEHPEYLDECLSFLGVDEVNLTVFLQEDIEASCGPKTAGCTFYPTHSIVLDKETLWQTALCHEALHQVALPFDYTHSDPRWSSLGEAGLNGRSKD